MYHVQGFLSTIDDEIAVVSSGSLKISLDISTSKDDLLPPRLRISFLSGSKAQEYECYLTPYLRRGILSYALVARFLELHKEHLQFPVVGWSAYSPHVTCYVTDNVSKKVSLLVFTYSDRKVRVVAYRDIGKQYTAPYSVATYECPPYLVDSVLDVVYKFIVYDGTPNLDFTKLESPLLVWKDALQELNYLCQLFSNRLKISIKTVPITLGEKTCKYVSFPTSLVSRALLPLRGYWGIQPTSWMFVQYLIHNAILFMQIKMTNGRNFQYPFAVVDALHGGIEILPMLPSVGSFVPYQRIIQPFPHPFYQLGTAKTLLSAALVGYTLALASPPLVGTSDSAVFVCGAHIPVGDDSVWLPVGGVGVILSVKDPIGVIYLPAGQMLEMHAYVGGNESQYSLLAQRFRGADFVFTVKADEFIDDPKQVINALLSFLSVLVV